MSIREVVPIYAQWLEESCRRLVCVEFYSPYSKVCEDIIVPCNYLSRKYWQALFLGINTDEDIVKVTFFNIIEVPTFLILFNGRLQDRIIGGNVQLLESTIQQYIQVVIYPDYYPADYRDGEEQGEYQDMDVSSYDSFEDSPYVVSQMNPRSRFFHPVPNREDLYHRMSTPSYEPIMPMHPVAMEQYSSVPHRHPVAMEQYSSVPPIPPAPTVQREPSSQLELSSTQSTPDSYYEQPLTQSEPPPSQPSQPVQTTTAFVDPIEEVLLDLGFSLYAIDMAIHSLKKPDLMSVVRHALANEDVGLINDHTISDWTIAKWKLLTQPRILPRKYRMIREDLGSLRGEEEQRLKKKRAVQRKKRVLKQFKAKYENMKVDLNSHYSTLSGVKLMIDTLCNLTNNGCGKETLNTVCRIIQDTAHPDSKHKTIHKDSPLFTTSKLRGDAAIRMLTVAGFELIGDYYVMQERRDGLADAVVKLIKDRSFADYFLAIFLVSFNKGYIHSQLDHR